MAHEKLYEIQYMEIFSNFADFSHGFSDRLTYSFIYSIYSFIFRSYLLNQGIPECDVIKGGRVYSQIPKLPPEGGGFTRKS